jgi:hypothetical protein
VPAAHGEHRVDPLVAEMVPPAHAVQTEEPANALIEPAKQMEQFAVVPGAEKPAGQIVCKQTPINPSIHQSFHQRDKKG